MWRVQLFGDPDDLRQLVRLSTPELTVREVDGHFKLEATELNDAADSSEVFDRAHRLIERLDGAAALYVGTRKPLAVGGVEGDLPDGRTAVYVRATAAATCTVTAMAPVVTMGRPDGTVETFHPADPIPDAMQVAAQHPAVSDVLRHWGKRDRDWTTLYQLREKVQHAMGGDREITARGWASGNELRRFDHTANSPAVLGDAGRHGVQKTDPPSKPMKHADAVALVSRLIKGMVEWFERPTV